jgi:hypothetical protein
LKSLRKNKILDIYLNVCYTGNTIIEKPPEAEEEQWQ